MLLDEGSEGNFIPTLDEAPKELPIGQSCSIPQKHGLAKVLEDLADLVGRHLVSLLLSSPALYLSITGTSAFDRLFSLPGR
jgi:hypothetical protein